VIYLDNAATSWPKPPEVAQATTEFLERQGGNPSRSGHRLSIEAGRVVYDAREAIASLFHFDDPLRVAFTLNATHAINFALYGLLREGDRVVTTGIEHNAVMRPLRTLQRSGVELTIVPCAADGSLDVADMERALKQGARMVALNHASNVVGTLAPAEEVARVAHEAVALVLLDAAQTAGVVPIDMQALDIDLLAFTGHKGLLGPTGTGGLVIGERVRAERIAPLIQGGTGTKSESEEQPGMLPEMLESGTPEYVTERGVEAIRAHEMALTQQILDGLADAPGVRLYGPRDPARQTGTVALTIDGLRVSEVGLRLDDEFGVLSRVGLQCAPMAHRTIGTFPEGTVRLAPGVFTTHEEIDQTVHAVRVIANR